MKIKIQIRNTYKTDAASSFDDYNFFKRKLFYLFNNLNPI